ncbi:UNVERIFIED_CONTAM: hypothetical protein Sradi_6315900 [Sesamum radiatum]|uniref:Uncharacterized protein n=1 Tax=Sesamum radiatum TaxID=300843 RepID=A0AAW2KF30_SESRA
MKPLRQLSWRLPPIRWNLISKVDFSQDCGEERTCPSASCHIHVGLPVQVI